MLSVVIRGVEPDVTDSEAETELNSEGHTITKCLRIKTKDGNSRYMIRVLTPHQPTTHTLLSIGAFIYKRRYRVELSRITAPIPIRCENCQTYNAHETRFCPNQAKCGYCSGPHQTKNCDNAQQPPKCSQCGEQHPTFSYKCKGRPQPEVDNPHFTVPLRLPAQTQTTSTLPSPTIEQIVAFITLTLQNLHPGLEIPYFIMYNKQPLKPSKSK